MESCQVPFQWNAIVVTCSANQWSRSLQQELDLRQAKGLFPKDTILLTIEDPKTDVGSGGATINALLAATEYMCAKKGYTAINADVLQDCYILILHSGKLYPYSSCRQAFQPLPVKSQTHHSLLCLIDLTYKTLTENLAQHTPPGIWVCSTDMMLSIPQDTKLQWPEADVCAITFPSSISYCKDHGIYKVDSQGFVKDILYKVDKDEMLTFLGENEAPLIVTGLVYFKQNVAEKILSFHVKPPLDSCTYVGLDSGQTPKQFSLFFDVLLPMVTDITEQDFVSGKRSHSFKDFPVKAGSSHDGHITKEVRQILWNELNSLKIKACVIEGGRFSYLTHSAQNFLGQILQCPLKSQSNNLVWDRIIHSFIECDADVSETCTLINSVIQKNVVIGEKCAIINCHLDGNIRIGKNSLCNGLHLDLSNKNKSVTFANDLVIQGFNILLKSPICSKCILTIHGMKDSLNSSLEEENSTFCNQNWKDFIWRTGIKEEQLWDTADNSSQKVLWTAKLFPIFHHEESVGMKEIQWLLGEVANDNSQVAKRWRESWRLSLSEILKLVDHSSEFTQRRKLFYEISEQHIKTTLLNGENNGLRYIYESVSLEPETYSQSMLKALDNVAIDCQQTPGTAARTLANIADLLACMAKGCGGLRSGPAANSSWNKAFQFLEQNQISSGVKALAKERNKWLHRPDLLIRASRHYEGAAQILIRQAVITGKQFVVVKTGELAEYNKWIRVECPARLDLSGGWTDTPPITYECGGAVTGISIIVNGKKPIGAKVKRTEKPVIVIEYDNTHLVIETLNQLEDYINPHSQGALIKAAFLCVNLISLSSHDSLKQQLLTKYQGGFEIHSWSDLPQGSGLGTSSILAGAVIKAIVTAAGKTIDENSLLHSVLYLEQLMTTGGGWQDQAGGLLGGITLGSSDAKIPLHINYQHVGISAEVMESFNQRLVLIYSGKTRLARNLLQNVIRDWYARKHGVVSAIYQLKQLAHQCASSFNLGDLESVGDCINKYWTLKKIMAPGCEPAAVKQLMDILQPFTYGMSLAGAGGGGFFYAVLKDTSIKKQLPTIISSIKGLESAVLYEASIDPVGMAVS
ncbi:L-fucose kinase-like [Argonauta hians]